MLKTLCLILSLSIFLPLNNKGVCFVFASNDFAKTKSISINEIAWMGTDIAYSDEWIELYNASKESVNLDGWKIEIQNKNTAILLEGQILAQNFFLLERTDDATVAGVEADLIYTGGLKNNGEHLKLINAKGELIESIDCSQGWFAGDNKTKQTMERINPLENGNSPENWQTSQDSGGTPKTRNSSGRAQNKITQTEYIQPNIEPNQALDDSVGLFFEKNTNGHENEPRILIASVVSIFSATIILILKKTLKAKY
jgi:hypothetical protein